MSRRLLPAVVAVLALGLSGSASAGDAAAGKAVFEGAKPACKGCHTDVKNPLNRAGTENTAEELAAWIRTPKDMMSRKGKSGTMPSYPPARISEADLENLVAYMATLK